MAVEIGPYDVRNGFETDLPTTEIGAVITVISSQVDSCLDVNEVPEETQRVLKTYAVRHVLIMQANSGRGMITRESAPSGASRGFDGRRSDYGSVYRELLEQLDAWGCVTTALDNENNVYLRAVGGRQP